jgi:hypothetical protein
MGYCFRNKGRKAKKSIWDGTEKRDDGTITVLSPKIQVMRKFKIMNH